LWDREGKAIRMAGSHTDITERKRTENSLKHLAYYDLLTDIPLRTTFMDKLKYSIIHAKKNKLKLAVLFLDLDNFKTINDTFGHHIGDRLLRRIAAKLKSCIRNSDTLSRIGGDEFALLVPDLSHIDEIDKIAKIIIESFNQPLDVNGHRLYITISIGIAIYPDNGQNGKTLLKKADIAMYIAKEKGKNSLQYYNNYMINEISLRNDIKKDLRTAIVNGELFLCYQPLINIETKKMVCIEALLRWKHPRKGIINPMEFIPIAEETRLIIPIGEWVLKTACSQLKGWHDMGYTDCSLTVNVSVIQLQQPDFAENVSKILEETGLSPEYLDLEITESVCMKSTHIVAMNLNCLKKQGVRISIDDFGTGFCCLEYLQKFAINNLKIDRTFICDIKADVNKAIIDAVISLGHKINMEIIAEGVETKEQYDYLKKKGCDKGFYQRRADRSGSAGSHPAAAVSLLPRRPGWRGRRAWSVGGAGCSAGQPES
jgi:diguanylate cyclase (GGDEF)-like protein